MSHIKHLIFNPKYATHNLMVVSLELATLWWLPNNRTIVLMIRFERSWLGRHNQGKSSSIPVPSDLAKTLPPEVPLASSVGKNQKSTEGSVIYVLGNAQRDVGDWLPLINKLDTIATYSITTATCQQQKITPNHACSCVCACRPEVPPYRTKEIDK